MESLPMTYKESNCFINALINKRHYYKDKNLKYVIGSVAFNGWCEYGGKDWTKADFYEKHDGHHSFDAHAWLEDDEGNIYDYVFPHYNYCAKVNTGKVMKIESNTLIEGLSKTACASLGLTYYPADKETQTAIFLTLFKWLGGVEEKLKSGKIVWNGNYLSEGFSTYAEGMRAWMNGGYTGRIRSV